MTGTRRIAIGQIAMRWTTRENVTAICRAMILARSRGAQICCFSELAITGFHRQIAREAKPEVVDAALREVHALSASLRMGVAFGAPTFDAVGARYISHLLVDEGGTTVAVVNKHGLTHPEATFFSRGLSRPVGMLHGLRCSAVICREVQDLDAVAAALPPGAADLIFVPGALRQDPDKAKADPPDYVRDIQRLAAATRTFVVQTNWPNALNRPEESVDGGGSTVASPDGELLFRLPAQASGLGIFNLGERQFEWHPQ